MQDTQTTDVVVETLTPGYRRAYRAVQAKEPCKTDEVAEAVGNWQRETAADRCRELFKSGYLDRRRLITPDHGPNPFVYWIAGSDAAPDDALDREPDLEARGAWIRRCPKGHTSISIYSETYRCNACEATYAGEPYDARQTSFPVEDDEPVEKATEAIVLEELVRRCNDPTTDRVLSRELDAGRPKQVGRTLAELYKEGLVERIGSGASRGYHWRPTDAGRRKVIEAERELVLAEGPDRARGQVTPLEHGLVTVVVAIAMLFAYAVSYYGVVA